MNLARAPTCATVLAPPELGSSPAHTGQDFEIGFSGARQRAHVGPLQRYIIKAERWDLAEHTDGKAKGEQG